MTSYSGYMMANQTGDTFTSRQIELSQPHVSGGPRLIYQDRAFGIRNWDEYTLFSSVPLADEPEVGRGDFEYQIYIVRGRAKIIMLAARRRIIDHALSQILDKSIFPNFRKINVYIDRVIGYCTTAESEFLVTSLHGRFSGSSRNIRSMSLYGDNVTNSPIYEKNHKFFNFHSCGLGRRLFDGLPRLKPNEEGEIVRVSHDGFLNLNLSTRHHAQELLRVVNFIVDNRWVEDWVPSAKEAPDD